jgi:hypothetical protein
MAAGDFVARCGSEFRVKYRLATSRRAVREFVDCVRKQIEAVFNDE